MLCYFLSVGVVWPNLELIATAAGVERSGATTILGLSQWFGVAGSYHVVVMDGRGGRAKPFTIGVLVAVVSLTLLLGPLSAVVFALAVCVYNYIWNLTQPVLIGAQASFDRTGAQVVRGSAMQMLGLALGPFLAASLISGDDYTRVIGAGIAFFAIAILAIVGPIRAEARLSATGP
jgi:hypothetical protein